MLQRILTDEDAEARVLALMTPDVHKFAISLGYVPDQQTQDALERLMLRDWIRLIDVSTASNAHLAVPSMLYRVFRVMPAAVEWFTKFTAENA